MVLACAKKRAGKLHTWALRKYTTLPRVSFFGNSLAACKLSDHNCAREV